MSRFLPSRRLFIFLIAFTLLTSCRSPQVTSPDITISITADGKAKTVTLPAGSTVAQAFQTAGITVGNLDKAEPPPYTVLNNGDELTLTRVEDVPRTGSGGRRACRFRGDPRTAPYAHRFDRGSERSAGQVQRSRRWTCERSGRGNRRTHRGIAPARHRSRIRLAGLDSATASRCVGRWGEPATCAGWHYRRGSAE